MSKLLGFLVLVVLLLSPVPVWILAEEATTVTAVPFDPECYAASCVVVHNSEGWGSGAVVAPYTILTAGHVVDHDGLRVETASGEVHDVVFVVRCGADAALLIVDAVLPCPLPISVEPPTLGEEIAVIGAPFSPAMRGSVMRGHVVNTRQPEGLFTDVDAGPGSSGGPAIHDGRIVGVLVSGRWRYIVVVPTTEFLELITWLRP